MRRKDKQESSVLSRRDFLKTAGVLGLSIGGQACSTLALLFRERGQEVSFPDRSS